MLLAVFGNRAVDDCLLELRELMTAQEFRCGAAVEAVAEHSIFPRYGARRPNEQDRRALADFTAHIKAAYEAGTLPERVEVPGKVPYAEMGGVPLHPRAGRACVSCGLCAQRCPVGAIPAENPKLTNKDKCITCMRCITICPHGARALSPKPLAAVGERLMAKALGGHKGNTLYLKG